MQRFDTSFLDTDINEVIQGLVLLLESHLDADKAYIFQTGAVSYDPGAVKEFGEFTQLSEYVKYHGGERQLKNAIIKLLTRKG